MILIFSLLLLPCIFAQDAIGYGISIYEGSLAWGKLPEGIPVAFTVAYSRLSGLNESVGFLVTCSDTGVTPRMSFQCLSGACSWQFEVESNSWLLCTWPAVTTTLSPAASQCPLKGNTTCWIDDGVAGISCCDPSSRSWWPAFFPGPF